MISPVVLRKLQTDRDSKRSVCTPSQAMLRGFSLAAASSIFLVVPALTLNVGPEHKIEATRARSMPKISPENAVALTVNRDVSMVPETSQPSDEAKLSETIHAPEAIDQTSETAKPAQTIHTPDTISRISEEVRPLVSIHAPEAIDPAMMDVIKRVNS